MIYFENEDIKENYLNFLLTNKESKNLLRERLSVILGLDFDGIYQFFLREMTGKFDYYVLMSRRCLVICQIFVAFFLLDGVTFDYEAVVISDKALPNYKKKMARKRVKIIDDILIHGRTISIIFDKITEYSDGCEPDIAVYMQNCAINCIRDEINNKINPTFRVGEIEWRRLSDKLVYSIFAASFPYTSFVTSFSVDNGEEVYERLMEQSNISLIDNTDRLQKKYGLTSLYCCERVETNTLALQALSEGQCVRVYKNETDDSLILIPYVFLKSVAVEGSWEFYRRIHKNLPDRYENIKEIFNNQDTDVFVQEFKARLLTCLLSIEYWKEFNSKYLANLCSDYTMDTDTIAKSFGAELAEELKLFLTDRHDYLTDVTFSIDNSCEIVNQSNKDLIEKLNSASDIKDYFQKAWYMDEIFAKEGSNRLEGLPLEAFIEGNTDYAQKNERLASLVNSWDTGVSAANCAALSEGRFIACMNAPGEQSYKIILEEYPNLMSALILVSKYYETNTKDRADYEKKRLDKLLELVSLFEVHFSICLDNIKEIVTQENGYMNSWNNAEIFREYKENDNYYDKELVNSFLQKINN